MVSEKKNSKNKIAMLQKQKKEMLKNYEERRIQHMMKFCKDKGLNVTREDAINALKQFDQLQEVVNFKDNVNASLEQEYAIESKITEVENQLKNESELLFKVNEEINKMTNKKPH